MDGIIRYRGTLNFAASKMQFDLCACGNLKDPGALWCQACHINRLTDANAIKQIARAKARKYIAWRVAQRGREPDDKPA